MQGAGGTGQGQGMSGGSKSAEAGARLSRETLEAVCRREPDALAVLFEHCFDAVYSLAYRLTGERTVAEDVSQEVFLKVHKAAAQLDPSRDPGPWLTAITYNACREHWRSRGHRLFSRARSLDGETNQGRVLSQWKAGPGGGHGVGRTGRTRDEGFDEAPGAHACGRGPPRLPGDEPRGDRPGDPNRARGGEKELLPGVGPAEGRTEGSPRMKDRDDKMTPEEQRVREADTRRGPGACRPCLPGEAQARFRERNHRRAQGACEAPLLPVFRPGSSPPCWWPPWRPGC